MPDQRFLVRVNPKVVGDVYIVFAKDEAEARSLAEDVFLDQHGTDIFERFVWESTTESVTRENWEEVSEWNLTQDELDELDDEFEQEEDSDA